MKSFSVAIQIGASEHYFFVLSAVYYHVKGVSSSLKNGTI